MWQEPSLPDGGEGAERSEAGEVSTHSVGIVLTPTSPCPLLLKGGEGF